MKNCIRPECTMTVDSQDKFGPYQFYEERGGSSCHEANPDDSAQDDCERK